jgi:uncharacterized protein with HEPN domain
MMDAACEAMGYAAGRARRDLESDTMLGRALVSCLAIIGEAAARVTTETRARHDPIPWTRIVGMRNRLIHTYFDIDHDEVWKTVVEDLPTLAEQLRVILDADDLGQ